MLRGLAAILIVITCLVLRTGRVQAVGSVLLQGQSGPAVVQLQGQLRRAGFEPGPLDGRFGPLTAAAVRTAQAAAGLPATGEADDRTRAEIAALASSYRVKPGDTLADIANRLGLDVRAIVQTNNLPSPDLIVPDQALQLPPWAEFENPGVAETVDSAPPLAAISADDAGIVVYLPPPPSRPSVSGAPPLPDPAMEVDVLPGRPVLAPLRRRPETDGEHQEADRVQPPAATAAEPTVAPAPGLVISVPQSQRRAALTFNLSAPADTATFQHLLATLSDHGARATFFLPPTLMETQPELGAALLEGGHRLAYLADAVPKQSHAAGIRLIRPAAGDWRPDLVAAARQSGLRVAMWSSIGLQDRGIDAETLTAQALKSLFPGAVLMLHAPEREWSSALPQMLRAITFTAGFQLVPLEDLLDLRTLAAPVEH